MRLDLKEDFPNEEEKTKRFSQYLLKIGRKISEILKSYQDPEKVKEWRRYVLLKIVINMSLVLLFIHVIFLNKFSGLF